MASLQRIFAVSKEIASHNNLRTVLDGRLAAAIALNRSVSVEYAGTAGLNFLITACNKPKLSDDGAVSAATCIHGSLMSLNNISSLVFFTSLEFKNPKVQSNW